MDVKPLRYFTEIVRSGSFTAAAEKLHVAQPAISMAIRKLEHELAVKLFHRSERKVHLTDEGEVLYRHAQRILSDLDEAHLEIAELVGLEKGEVRVGVPGMMGSYYFPPILMAFRHAYPNLTLKVIEGGTGMLQNMLEQGDLDLSVIVADRVPDSLESFPLIREQMLVTVNKEHPFTAFEAITAQQFFQEELVLFREGYFHRKTVDNLARAHGAKPNVGFETNLIALIKSIVRNGFGISTLLSMVIEPHDQLVTRPFSPGIWLDLNIAWRKDGYLSKANQAFLNFLLEHAQRNTKQS